MTRAGTKGVAGVTSSLQPAFLFSLGFLSFRQSCSGPKYITYHLLTGEVCPPPTTRVFGVTGGSGRPEDLTEEVDLFPEGQADLLPAGQQPRLQCAARRLCPQVSRPEGAHVLWGLHPTAVSAWVGGLGVFSLHFPIQGSHVAPSSPGTTWGSRPCAPTTCPQPRQSSPVGSTCRAPRWSSRTPSGCATTGPCPHRGPGR